MRTILAISLALFFAGCATNTPEVEIDDNAQIAVCGEVDGQKQTYPTIADLKNDGAKLLYYEPCYEEQ
jgi:PBP1b-binding outer membrane lipoprotein LpoB